MSDEQSGVVTLKVRVSPEFREKIVNTAKQNNRSMNQEIVARLEKSFEDSNESYEDALAFASFAVAKTLNDKGVAWSEVQKVVIDMLAKAREYKKAP